MTKSENLTVVTLPSDREIVITRSFNAPRVLVWKMWTQPEHLTHWWGPKEWTLPVCEIDLRADGTWRYCMRGLDGEDACGMAIYREIIEPELLVFTDMFTDKDGNPLKDMPQGQVTVMFSEQAGTTIVTISTVYQNAEDRDRIIEMGLEQGMLETLDRLEVELENI